MADDRDINPRRTSALSGFAQFIRERGVAGFAIGFILGGAAQTLVKALMDDIVSPLLNIFLGPAQRLSDFAVAGFKVGDFISALINFVLLCLVIYIIFKFFHLERLDKVKE